MKKANVSNGILKNYFSCHIISQLYHYISYFNKKIKLKLRHIHNKIHKIINSSSSTSSPPSLSLATTRKHIPCHNKANTHSPKIKKFSLEPPPPQPQHLHRHLDRSRHCHLAQSRNLHFPQPWSVNQSSAQQMGLPQPTWMKYGFYIGFKWLIWLLFGCFWSGCVWVLSSLVVSLWWFKRVFFFGSTKWWLVGYLVVPSCRDVGFLEVLGLWFYRFCLLVVQQRERELNKLIKIGSSFNILLG